MKNTGDTVEPSHIESASDVDLSIDEAVSRVEAITTQLDNGTVSLGTGKQLYEEAMILIEYIEQEAQVDDVGKVDEMSD